MKNKQVSNKERERRSRILQGIIDEAAKQKPDAKRVDESAKTAKQKEKRKKEAKARAKNRPKMSAQSKFYTIETKF